HGISPSSWNWRELLQLRDFNPTGRQVGLVVIRDGYEPLAISCDAPIKTFGVWSRHQLGWRGVVAFEEREGEPVVRTCVEHAIVDVAPWRHHDHEVEPIPDAVKGEDRRVPAIAVAVEVEITMAR